jgi:hypothetical protein
MESILQRIIKRIHLIFKKSLKKNINDKNMLATFKKLSYFLKCGILKLKKFKECFKIPLESQSFKSSLPHINGL